MRQDTKLLLIVLAGVVLVLIASPIGAVGIGIIAVLAWLWRRLEDYMLRRHERKLAALDAAFDKEMRPEIPVEESILAKPPD
jgi:hypothetical protein